MKISYWEFLLRNDLWVPHRFKKVPGQHPMITLNELGKKYQSAGKNGLCRLQDPEDPDGVFLFPPEISMVMTEFYSGKRLVYKIARHFGEQLAKVNLNLSVTILRETDGFVWIEFPDNLRYRLSYSDGEFYSQGALVWVVTKDGGPDAFEFTITRTGEEIQAYIYVMSPLFDRDGNPTMQFDSLKIAVPKGASSVEQSVIAALSNHLGNYNDKGEFDPDVINFGKSDFGSSNARIINVDTSSHYYFYLLKCLIYIQSGDPDLRKYRPPKIESKNPKKIRSFYRKHHDNSLIPMILVGYDFKKPVVYQVGETSVTGHFRWQPYGEGRTKVKLIWIDEHLRHYKTEPTKED